MVKNVFLLVVTIGLSSCSAESDKCVLNGHYIFSLFDGRGSTEVELNSYVVPIHNVEMDCDDVSSLIGSGDSYVISCEPGDPVALCEGIVTESDGAIHNIAIVRGEPCRPEGTDCSVLGI